MSVATETYKPTAEQREKAYCTMVRAVARGDRHEIDPAITEASGRFAIDAEKDLEVANRRVKAVADMEAARAELRRLAENPPPPRPTAQTPISEFTTLGQLAAALRLAADPMVAFAPDADHTHAKATARATINRSRSFLVWSADRELDIKATRARQEITRVTEAQAERGALEARRDKLAARINKPAHSEEARAEVIAARREHPQVCRRIANIASLDSERVNQLQGEIEAAQAAQLDAANMEFTRPNTEPSKPRPDMGMTGFGSF